MIIGPLMITAVLAAQPPVPGPVTRRAYLQCSILLSHQPAASEGYHRVSPNLHGTAAALSIGAGGFMSPSFALEGELFYGGMVSMPQRFSYTFSEDYIAGSRDLVFSELVRYRPGGRARVELVVGGGYVRTTTSEKSIVVTSGVPPVTSHPPDRSHPYNGFAITGGLDGAIRLSDRVALTPSFRLRWIRRPDPLIGESLGIGSYAFQFGAGLRFR